MNRRSFIAALFAAPVAFMASLRVNRPAQPRWLIDRRCEETIRDFERVTWSDRMRDPDPVILRFLDDPGRSNVYGTSELTDYAHQLYIRDWIYSGFE